MLLVVLSRIRLLFECSVDETRWQLSRHIEEEAFSCTRTKTDELN